MKGHASFLLAFVGTVFGMSANLHAVAAQDAGATAFAVTLCIAVLWLASAVLCGDSALLCRSALGLMACFALLSLLGLIPALRESEIPSLVCMLAAAPFYGFGALYATAAEAVVAGAGVCVFLGLLHLAVYKRYARRRDADMLALEREMTEPAIDPEMGGALERKAKKLLGLRDPELRLSRGR